MDSRAIVMWLRRARERTIRCVDKMPIPVGNSPRLVAPTSHYFAGRAEYYWRNANRAPTDREAERLLGLANLFANLAHDLSLIEREKSV
jgi:hypothetical protein